MDFTSKRTTTLTDFIREEQTKHEGASGTFTDILLSIALGAKVVSRGINRAGFEAMFGLAGETNVQGEEVQKLDVYADKVFTAILGRTGEFVSMVSEEQDKIHSPKEGGAGSHYVIAFDPLDGSSNIDVNVSIGTIFGIYRRISELDSTGSNEFIDFKQPGYNRWRRATPFMARVQCSFFSSGNGVNGFTLYPTIGEFILTHSEMKMPDHGTIYSCNAANYSRWEQPIQNYIDKLEASESPRYSQRYVGSLVADFHRTLLKGGIFLYPGDNTNPNGKLRLLYECAPMAFICEQAGGRSSTGSESVLNVVPESIHQRIPLFIGSRENVEEFEAFLKA